MPFAAGQMVALSSGSLKETFTAGKRKSTRQRYEDESMLLLMPLRMLGVALLKDFLAANKQEEDSRSENYTFLQPHMPDSVHG